MEHRTVQRLLIEPCGQEAPPLEFGLILEEEKQARRGSRDTWRRDSRAPGNLTRTPLMMLTRRKLATLIRDGADWLAFVDDSYSEPIAKEEEG